MQEWTGLRMAPGLVSVFCDAEEFYEEVIGDAYADGDVPGVGVVRFEYQWAVLDYLFTVGRDVNEDPLGWALFLPNESFGRAESLFFAILDEVQVCRVAEALVQVDRGFLEERLDIDVMDDAEVMGDYEDGALDRYIVESVERLKAFYRAAAQAGEMVVQLETEL